MSKVLGGRTTWVLVGGLALILACGCKEKIKGTVAEETPAIEAAQRLPEGTNVLAALQKKDYESAVAGLAKLQEEVGNGDLAAPFLTLKMYVKSQLIELAPTDPKAAEALSTVRMMTQGR
jgi:hypothetical protein